MRTSLQQIIKEALDVQCEVFSELVRDATQLLSYENGKIGKLDISGRLVKLEPAGEALIVGDLHGDLESLIDILKGSHFLRKLDRDSDVFLIFLGDYGDRGPYSAEVYYTVLNLKLLFPQQVILMRGNHEGPEDLTAEPHDLPSQFQLRFGEKWLNPYTNVRKLFAYLHNAVIVEGRYLLIHGGLPSRASTIKDLADAHGTHPKQSFLEEMLWSDPNEGVERTCASPRGAGKLFSEQVTSEVLEKLNVNVLIRGHEPCPNGFRIDHNGKILTLFSRKGPPYFNAYGAYLDAPLSEKIENAEQLIPFIHTF